MNPITDLKELIRIKQRANTSNIKIIINIIKTIASDELHILALQRARSLCKRKRIPILGHIARRMQTSIYGIEIGKDTSIGAGVYFVHPIGITVGGNSKIGRRVIFYGNNTIGTAKDNGYPTIENDVKIGCGAKIIGPIKIGSGTIIGANSVVTQSTKKNTTVVGIPARQVKNNEKSKQTDRKHNNSNSKQKSAPKKTSQRSMPPKRG